MASNNEIGSTSGRSNRGFAAMDPREQREIARKGGEAVSQDREHMASIGRKGGEASGGGNRGSSNRQGAREDSQGGQGLNAGSVDRDAEGRFESSSRNTGFDPSSNGSRSSRSSGDLSGGMNAGGRDGRH